jgi:flagellar hook-associated protein 3 FlgL
MRVNPNMISDVVAAIQKTQQQEQTAIEQITTGKRVNSPSDDPAAAAAMVTSMDQAGRLDQYTQNVSSLQSMLQTVDSSLSAVTTSLNQAISIGTEGGNGTLTSEQRHTLANQVNGILATVVSQANLSYQGVYLFGGTNTTQAPFSTPTTSGSPYTYNGNLDTNSVPVNDGLSLTVNVPGEDIFQNPQGDVLGSLQSL